MAGTTETIDQAGGSAATQGDLWGERARDWAEVLEGWNGWGIPLYRHILERVTVERGTRVLDMGCGAGRFCRIAADQGAHLGPRCDGDVCSDRSGPRPGGGIPCRGHRASPWPDNSFDVVTGFNSFIFAANITGALREARRVARPGANVAITVFGRRNGANQQTYSGRLDSFCQRRPEPVRWSRAARSGNP